MATKKRKQKYPENADLVCKDCGSRKFTVLVEVFEGEIYAKEVECAECAIDQISLNGPRDTLDSEFITTTLDPTTKDE